MAFYTYKAKDIHGKSVSGLVEASSEQQAARLLRQKELYITALHAKSGGISLAGIRERLQTVTLKDTVDFTRQLAILTEAGLSLPQSLTIIRTQTTNENLSAIFNDLETTIIGGVSFANALGKHPKFFSPIYIALVRAGEASGSLDSMLLRMAEMLENQLELKAKLRGALVYPVIILLGMIGVIVIMMTVVVPRMTELYSDFGVQLPWATQLIIAMSNAFLRFWWLLAFGIPLGSYLFIKWKKTPIGKHILDTLMLRMPLFGDLLTKITMSEFSRTLGMLISSGIHILDSLTYIKESLTNTHFKAAITSIAVKIEKGSALGDSFAEQTIFPPIVPQMIRIGEETGKLDESMIRLSQYFKRESDHILKNLTTAMEPAIMIFLGLGVGFIVFSIITPIYSLTNSIK